MQNKKDKLIKLVSYLSVITATIIIIIKLYAFIVTDSLSLLSSLVDSILDILVSIINLFAIRYALKPADQQHRFGHGKAESLAALIQAAFIAGSALFIIIEAIQRLYNPIAIATPYIGIIVMILSTILTILLIMVQSYVIRKTNSLVIKADSLHYKVDLLVNMVVILSFIISYFYNNYLIDIITASLIAIYIAKGSWKLGKNAFDHLMDKEFEEKDRQKIINIVLSNKDALGMHDLRTRHSGIKSFIQLHLELDGKLELEKAHQITEDIENAILKKFPDSEVIIHQDPVVIALD